MPEPVSTPMTNSLAPAVGERFGGCASRSGRARRAGVSIRFTTIGPITFGRTCRDTMRMGPAPAARAARMNSWLFTERVKPRTIRAATIRKISANLCRASPYRAGRCRPATATTARGFPSVLPGDVAERSVSSLDWSGPGISIANAGIVGIDADREIDVIAGPGGSFEAIIDIRATSPDADRLAVDARVASAVRRTVQSGVGLRCERGRPDLP